MKPSPGHHVWSDLLLPLSCAERRPDERRQRVDGVSSAAIGAQHSITPRHDPEPCDRESGKGEAAIKSQALGLLNPGMKRSQTAALTVPYVVSGLCAKPAKYSWIKPSLKLMRGYLATISSRSSAGN